MPTNAGALGGTAPASPTSLGGTVGDVNTGGYKYVPPSSTSSPGSVPSSYSIGNDPAYLYAQMLQKQQNDFASQELGLAGHSSSSGYTSQAGVKSAQLAYQLAQQQDQAQKDQATHQLPITLLGIVNGLAAHGVGNSGDATYLPGEAKYAYDNVLQGLQQDLAAKQANVQIAQSDYQAAAAANAAQASQANANELARAQLNYKEAVAQNNNALSQTVLQLYQTAVQNGTALDPSSLALLKSLGQ